MSLRAALLSLLISAGASAAGFALPEQSARSLATAGTGTASAEGAGTVYYNVGNLAFEEGYSAELSGIVIAPSFRYEPIRAVDGTPTAVKPRLFPVPALFLAVPVTEALFVGLGAFSNFGLGLEWPEDFDGRFDATAANITTFTLNPSASYRINDRLSVGAGVSVVRATVELEQQLNFVDSEGKLRLGAGTWGVGVNAGIGGRFLDERLAVGLSYRSSVRLGFRGAADFQQVPREFEATLVDQDVATSLSLPHLLSLGASYRLTSALRVTADLTYTGWSTFQALTLDFLGPESDALDQSLPRAWQDTLSVRAGAELAITHALTARLGAGYDPTPSPSNTVSPSLPDSDRVILSAGAGHRFGNFTVDVGYLLVLVTPRVTTGEAFPARYSGTAHLVGASVGFRQ